MFDILKYLILMALVVHNLKMATALSADELTQMFRKRLKKAKNRERPYDLLHIVFCFATLAPAVLIRIVLSGAVEIVLNLLDMSAEAAKKFDELGKRDMQVPGSDETPRRTSKPPE